MKPSHATYGESFRKKPVVIQAKQWFSIGDHPVVSWLKKPDPLDCERCGKPYAYHGAIRTLEDTDNSAHIVCPADWIIRGLKGEFYACKPEIFALTYEPVQWQPLDDGSGMMEARSEKAPHIKLDPALARDELLKGAKKRQESCGHGNKGRSLELCRSCVLDEAVAVIVELHNEWADDLLSAPSATRRSTGLSDEDRYWLEKLIHDVTDPIERTAIVGFSPMRLDFMARMLRRALDPAPLKDLTLGAPYDR